MSQVYLLEPMSTTGQWSFIGLIAMLVGIAALVFFKRMPQPAKVASMALMVPLILAFSWVLYQINDAKLVIDEQTLTLDVPVYGFSLPLSEVDMQAISYLDWHTQPDLKPRLRTNGIGMPELQLGWFKLKNQQKAFMAMTDQSKLIMIPTSHDYPIILSLQQPGDLVGK
ncbi:hypothetical protein FLM48_20540 [Shewanella sp. Scap07]|uniref:PH domain-containing protein n=1 Tax=Shewanella sp. Scap07 TaxID=2589987 RepID=UPI0015B7A282|nr:PH domain-containing protein [Shewanella sp. Scap07]QLE87248.1 hypothetical protein FLM48_20540 [Shewanella sp. Scap07]